MKIIGSKNPRIFNPRIIQSHIMSLLCPSDQELLIQKSSWSEGHNKADSWQWTASVCKGSLALDVMYEPQINGRAIMPNLDNMKGQKGNRCVQHRLNIEEIPLISFAQDLPGGIRIRSYESIVFFFKPFGLVFLFTTQIFIADFGSWVFTPLFEIVGRNLRIAALSVCECHLSYFLSACWQTWKHVNNIYTYPLKILEN